MLEYLLIAAAAATAQPAMDHGKMAMMTVTGERPAPTARAQIVDPSGREIGAALLSQGPAGVLMQVQIAPGSGLSPGWHGLHFHEVGQCDGAGGFKSAGGHLGQKDAPHGLLTIGRGEKIAGHAGDLPNIGIAADGSGMAEVVAPKVRLQAGNKPMPKGIAALMDGDGSSLIVHVGQDDHWSQPIGNAGGRAGCGVIQAR